MPQGQASNIAQDLWSRLSDGDEDGARALMHDRFVQEWPQSGERIVGPDDALAVNRSFPGGLPRMTVRRTVGEGDLAVMETVLQYADGSVYRGVSILETADGKVVKETDYFAQPFDPPQWRSQWVERI